MPTIVMGSQGAAQQTADRIGGNFALRGAVIPTRNAIQPVRAGREGAEQRTLRTGEHRHADTRQSAKGKRVAERGGKRNVAARDGDREHL